MIDELPDTRLAHFQRGGAFRERSAAGREGVLLRISLPLLTYIQNAIMAGQNETLSNNRLNSSFELNNLEAMKGRLFLIGNSLHAFLPRANLVVSVFSEPKALIL